MSRDFNSSKRIRQKIEEYYSMMNFHNVNKFNDLVNTFSGNCLPVTANNQDYTISKKIYSYVTSIICLIYSFGVVQKLFSISSFEQAQFMFFAVVDTIEIIVLLIHMHHHRDKYCLLIKKLNRIFSFPSNVLEKLISSNIKPVMKIFKGYYSMCLLTGFIWSLMPLMSILEKDEFTNEDFSIPMDFFSLFDGKINVTVFIIATFFESIVLIYLVAKKAAINLYLIHFVKISTANYLFIRHQLAETFRTSRESELMEKLQIILEQQRLMIQVTKEFPTLFSLNITATYLHATVELCSVAFMIVTAPGGIFEQLVILLYTSGLIMEIYLICYSIDELKRARVSIVDEAFHEPWYDQKLYLQKMFMMIIFTSLIQCRLSTSKTFDLSLPIFKVILSNAYSVCLLLLEVQ